ncbi:MAG: YbhN family protein [Gemmatimonadaceae bacterium]
MTTTVLPHSEPLVDAGGDVAPVRTERGGRHALRRWGMAALSVALGAGAFVALRRSLSTVRYHEVARIVGALPSSAIALAFALTVLCYVALIGYDVLALRYVGRRLAPARTAFASFLAYAFSQNLGISALTGASIRYRFWSAWGLSTGEIAQGIAFTTTSFWLGVMLVGGSALLASPLATSGWLAVGRYPLAVALLLPPLLYLLWCARARRRWSFADGPFRRPNSRWHWRRCWSPPWTGRWLAPCFTRCSPLAGCR